MHSTNCTWIPSDDDDATYTEVTHAHADHIMTLTSRFTG